MCVVEGGCLEALAVGISASRGYLKFFPRPSLRCAGLSPNDITINFDFFTGPRLQFQATVAANLDPKKGLASNPDVANHNSSTSELERQLKVRQSPKVLTPATSR
jgi:hypothetical protein